MKFLNSLAFACLAMSSSVMAQSLSPADIIASVDAKANDLAAYQAILADPDPNRSLAAMQVFMASGDDVLVRMALEYGLYSPNGTARKIAVAAYMDTKPTLSVYLDGSALSKDAQPNFRSRVGDLGGSVSAGMIGFVPVSVMEKIDELNCWYSKNNGFGQECGVHLNETTVSISVHNLNAHGTLAEDGALIGSATVYGVAEVLPATIRIVD